MWGTGRDAEQQLAAALTVMAEDPAVGAVAFAVDLVPEFDGDESYQHAVLAAAATSSKPLVVLAGLPASVDPVAAARLRAAGVPVLKGTRTGLLALRHLLDHARAVRPGPGRDAPAPPPARAGQQAAVVRRLIPGGGNTGLPRSRPGTSARRCCRTCSATTGYLPPGAVRQKIFEEAVRAAAGLGYPVVLKTDEPRVTHKSDVGGVLTGLAGPAAVAAGYRDLAARLGPRVLVCQTAASRDRDHPAGIARMRL